MSTTTSAVITTIVIIQAKHEGKMLSLQKMIAKFLLLKEFPFITPSPDPEATLKTYPNTNSLLKTTTERWNQIDLGYFDPHFNRIYEKSEIVSVGKDIYYRNVVFFVHGLQSLVTFKKVDLMKTIIIMLLWSSTLKWYISELSNFDRYILNNDPGMKARLTYFPIILKYL